MFARIKYLWKSRGRHGTHSPFVYRLVAECLLKPDGTDIEERLKRHLHNWTIATVDLTINAALLQQDITGMHCFFVKNIITNSSTWQQLRTDVRFQLSADCYDFGLLFCNNDIKEKQHFVLKWRR